MATGAHHSDHHHIVPVKVYLAVLFTLLCFTVLTVLAAHVDFGEWNVVIAMLISSIKASLVLAIFMHLKYDNKLYAIVIGTALFFLVVLYFFSSVDIWTRYVQHSIL